MIKLLLPLLALSVLSSCGKIEQLNDLVNGSTYAIQQNIDAVTESTQVISTNAVVIDQSTRTLEDNHRLLLDAAGH